ncbi:MAG: sigma-70 family RNA polymerase sigma factor [Anaerolineae bacterium]|nr:sigma-70 family RNA polymerase sigma factor [Anaerolineae bacterium]
MDYTQLSDDELLQLITRQDAEALAHFHDRFAQTTFNLIMHIVRERSLAEDLLQETFLQVWHKAQDFKGDGVVAAWLYRIARNKCLDALRREKARPQTEELSSLTVETGPSPAAFPVEQNVNRRLDQQKVRGALLHLPEEQRQCLELAFFGGLSQREIAAHTNTPLGTVKTRLSLGLAKLEHSLRTVGYREEDVR